MKNIKMIMIAIAVAALMLPSLDNADARGGGGHMGGGHMGGGGWSGGHGGGDFERGGGDFGRGGEGRGGDWGDRGGDWGRGGDRPGRGGEQHGGDHGDHGGHHKPDNNPTNTTNVNVYGGGGWDGGWGWGAADDALAGMAVGAAIGAAASQPSTVIVEQPSTTVIQQPAPGTPAYGSVVTTLPSGCVSQNVKGIMAYQCGPTWYRPFFGSSGVYYEVVSPPPAEGTVSTGQGQ